MVRQKNWFDLSLKERQDKLNELVSSIVDNTIFSENYDENEEERLRKKIEMLCMVGGSYEDIKNYLLQWQKVCQGGK